MIDQEFVINKELLRQYFLLEENKEKVIQDFSYASQVFRIMYHEEFYDYLRKHQTSVKLWKWFETSTENKFLGYPFRDLTNDLKNSRQWKTSDNMIIEFMHSLEAKIDQNIGGTLAKASPF